MHSPKPFVWIKMDVYRPGARRSWKVMEFEIFQAWKVMESGVGHGKSWKIKPNGCRIVDHLHVSALMSDICSIK